MEFESITSFISISIILLCTFKYYCQYYYEKKQTKIGLVLGKIGTRLLD